MLKVIAEFETRTFAGLTNCTASRTAQPDNEGIEEIVSYIKKMYDNENSFGMTVTVMNEKRIFRVWNNVENYEYVCFDETGETAHELVTRLDKRLIRTLVKGVVGQDGEKVA